MKTPQEEAAEAFRKAYNKWFHEAPPTTVNLQSFFANEIPLAELIAVARAAKKVVQNAEGELLIDTYFNKEGAELLGALQALRATGNVAL